MKAQPLWSKCIIVMLVSILAIEPVCAEAQSAAAETVIPAIKKATPGLVKELCIVAILGVLIYGGIVAYKAVCKLENKIKKQQTDPDDPPQSTNAPPTNPKQPTNSVANGQVIHAMLTSRTALTSQVAIMDELTFILNQLSITNAVRTNALTLADGLTTTDISGFSSTNLNLLDHATGNPYTLWTRGAIFWSTNLADLPGTNNVSAWMKDPSKCAVRVRAWIACDSNVITGSPLSQITVIDGHLINPAITNYAQCQLTNGYNYVPDLDAVTNEINTVPQPLDTTIPSKFFELSPADTQ